MFRNRWCWWDCGLGFGGMACGISGGGFFGAGGLTCCRLIVLGLEISRIWTSISIILYTICQSIWGEYSNK